MNAHEKSVTDVDLIVRNGTLITMDPLQGTIEGGAVAIAAGRIVAVGTEEEVCARHRAAEVVDAGGAPVHPGLIETHLHCTYQLFRGALSDDLAEEDVWDDFESGFYSAVQDDDEHASATMACLEMIRNGTTTFLEPGTVLAPDAVAEAVSAVGMRAVLGDPFIWDMPGGLAMGKEALLPEKVNLIPRAPGNPTAARARLGAALSRNADPDALVRGHIAVLGLGTASTELLVDAKHAAREAGVVLNFHHAYSPSDTAADRRRLGPHPIAALAELGVVDADTTMAHVNHLTEPEFAAIVATGASVSWAPAASMMWGHGSVVHGRHADLHRAGANVGLGSDSPNWSNRLDLFRQMSFAVLGSREAHGDRGYLVAEDGLEMATRAGARAAGLEGELGVLRPGMRADLVIHSLRRPELLPLTDPVRNLVYSGGSSTVDTVVIDGRVVLRGGAFVAFDEEAALARASVRSTRLLDRMGYVVRPNARRG